MSQLSVTWVAVPLSADAESFSVYAIPFFAAIPDGTTDPNAVDLAHWPKFVHDNTDTWWIRLAKKSDPSSGVTLSPPNVSITVDYGSSTPEQCSMLWTKIFSDPSEMKARADGMGLEKVRVYAASPNIKSTGRLSITRLPSDGLHAQIHKTYLNVLWRQLVASLLRQQASIDFKTASAALKHNRHQDYQDYIGKTAQSQIYSSLLSYAISRRLNYLKWPSRDAASNRLNQPPELDLDPPFPFKLRSLSNDEEKQTRRNWARLGLVPGPQITPATDAQKSIQTKMNLLASGTWTSIRPRSDVHPDDWESMMEARIFHARAPKTDPSLQSADNGDLQDQLDAAAKLSTVPDILQRISLVRNYPHFLRPLCLAIKLDVKFKLPQLNSGDLLVISVGNNKTGAYGPDSKQTTTHYSSGASTVFTAAHNEMDTERGYLPLAGCDDAIAGAGGNPDFILTSVDVNAATLKLISTATAMVRTEGAWFLADSSGNILHYNFLAAPLINGNVFGSDLRNKLLGLSSRALTRRSRPFTWHDQSIELGHSGRLVKSNPIWFGSAFAGSVWQLPLENKSKVDFTHEVPDNTTLPSLHSDGISLVWRTRADWFKNRQTRASSAKNVLYSDDLILGFLPEVQAKSSENGLVTPWHGLTHRSEQFFDDKPVDRCGLLRISATQALDAAPGDTPTDDLHLGPTIFRWNGWTLGVAKPFKSGSAADQESQEKLAVKPVWHLLPHLEATESMPLRYGMWYRFRVGVVNLSGETSESNDEADATSWVHYLRYEPIKPPELLLDRQPKDENLMGRSLHRMVVTEDADKDIRWLAPPRTTVEMAERHGMIDVDDIRGVGSFNDVRLEKDGEFRTVDDSSGKTKSPLRLPPGALPKTPYFPDPIADFWAWDLTYIPDGDVHARSLDADPDVNKCLPFYPARTWPKARAGKIVLKATDQTVPSVRQHGTTLEIYLPPNTNATLSLRCVPTSAHGELMALFDKSKNYGDIVTADIFPQVREMKFDQDEILQTALAGESSLVNPSITLELSHACIRPAEAPDIQLKTCDGSYVPTDPVVPSLARAKDKTAVVLNADLSAHVPSTGKIAIKAAWLDPVLDKEGRVHWHNGAANLSEQSLPIQLGGSVSFQATPFNHNFPSTGYRLVAYSATATSRYVDQFKDAPPDKREMVMAHPPRYRVLNCSRPTPPSFEYAVPTFRWSSGIVDNPEDASLPAYRSGRQAVLRFFFAPRWFTTGEDEVAAVLIVNQAVPENGPLKLIPESVLSALTQWGGDPTRVSSLPDERWVPAEKFDGYVTFLPGEIVDLPKLVPILQNQDDPRTTVLLRSLSQDTLRLLEEWSNTAANPERELREKLAGDFDRHIRKGASDDPSVLAHRRQWFTDQFPEIAASDLFDRSGWAARQVPLDTSDPTSGDPPDTPRQFGVRTIPYSPTYDAERRLWYIDVGIHKPEGEYFFAHIAIARFQPHSITTLTTPPSELHLSLPIKVDFLQITPDRFLTVWRDQRDETGMTLRVRISSVESNQGSLIDGWASFVVLVLKPKDDQWIVDKSTEITPDQHGVCDCSIKWEERTDPRRLMVVEREHLNPWINELSQPNSPIPFNAPYIDILDI